MAHFVFQHKKNTANIGDQVCTPARWLPFGDNSVQIIGETVPPCDVAVFGGGQIFAAVVDAIVHQAAAARHCVTWAIGMRAAKRKVPQVAEFKARTTLIGCRDIDIPDTTYVPCPSCLAPGLSAPPAPQHAVVMYLHAKKSDDVERPFGIPRHTNYQGGLDDALSFIASGETVVTNSFHGTYWAMLMGRRVLCLPFSGKFNGFARMPALADPGNWQGDLSRAYALPGYLEECRAATAAFHAKVMNLV